jgi:hypothetical protein
MFFDDPEAFDVFEEDTPNDLSSYKATPKQKSPTKQKHAPTRSESARSSTQAEAVATPKSSILNNRAQSPSKKTTKATKQPATPSTKVPLPPTHVQQATPPSRKRPHSDQGPARSTQTEAQPQPPSADHIAVKSSEQSNNQDSDTDMADRISSSMVLQDKRPRLSSPMPTVTDSFEQDLSREVAASAGLMPSAEGSNVVLSHQVKTKTPNLKCSCALSFTAANASTLFRSAIKSHFHPIGNIHHSHNMYPTTRQHGHTRLSSTLSKGLPPTQLSVESRSWCQPIPQQERRLWPNLRSRLHCGINSELSIRVRSRL